MKPAHRADFAEALGRELAETFGEAPPWQHATFAGDVEGLDVPKAHAERRKGAEETLRQLPGSKSKIVYRPLPSDDPKRRKPDITLAKELLGWEPKVPLAEGLSKTIEYFRSRQ